MVTSYVTLARGNWGPGWTTFMPFQIKKKPFFLSYSSGDGAFEWCRINASGSGYTTLAKGDWDGGWTDFVPFRVRGSSYMFCYRRRTGAVSWDKIKSNGAGYEHLASGTWPAGWTVLSPYVYKGRSYILAYDGITGAYEFHRIDTNGRGAAKVSSGRWSKGWTTLMPFTVNRKLLLLSYKKGVGSYSWDRFVGPARLKTLEKGTWDKGWTAFMPYSSGDTGKVPFLLSYKSGSGQFEIDRLTDDADRFRPVDRGKWDTGWTTFMPFTIGGNSHMLCYKVKAGNFEWDRLTQIRTVDAILIAPNQGHAHNQFLGVARKLKRELYRRRAEVVKATIPSASRLGATLRVDGGGTFSFDDYRDVKTVMVISHAGICDGPNLDHEGKVKDPFNQPWRMKRGTACTDDAELVPAGVRFWSAAGESLREKGKIVLMSCHCGENNYPDRVIGAAGHTVYGANGDFAAANGRAALSHARQMEKGRPTRIFKKFPVK